MSATPENPKKEIIMAAKKTTPKKTAKAAPLEAMVETPDAANAPEVKAPKAKSVKSPKPDKPNKLSALDAAAKVLADAGQALTCGEMIELMTKKGLWTSPNGATPSATLYASILRECKVKGEDARFIKTERGKFASKATA
jgi:hypothetical protein